MWDDEDDVSYIAASVINVVNIDTKNADTDMILSLDEDLWIEASFSDHPQVFNELNEEFEFFQGFIDLYQWSKSTNRFNA